MRSIRPICALFGFVLLLWAAPAVAATPTIVNGDFEAGNLSGWQQSSSGSGGWFAYTGTVSPLSGNPIASPPQGKYAATSDETGSGAHILFQDITIPPGSSSSLGLTAYYDSHAPIAVPSPDSLDPTIAMPNQQYRIELIKPTAPINTVDPSDILLTIFRTHNGDPTAIQPTTFTADLTPFAGQTVRLRFADVDNDFFMNSSVDAIGFPPSNRFALGRLKRNLHTGTALVPVKVPGPGTLELFGNNVRSRTVTVTGAGTAHLGIAARNAPLSTLRRSGRVRVKLRIVYTPSGGVASSQKLVLDLKRRHS